MKKILMIMLTVITIIGCKKETSKQPVVIPVAHVNFYQAYPFTNPGNLIVNNNLLIGHGFLYLDSTGYRDISVKTPPTVTYQSAQTFVNYIYNLQLPLQKDSSYSVFINPNGLGNNIANDTLVLNDNLNRPATGKLKLRVLQTYKEVQIYSWGQPLSSVLLGPDTLYKNLGFKFHTTYKEVSAGNYNFQIALIGKLTPGGPAGPVFHNTTVSLNLKEGHIYTVWCYSKVQPDSTYTQGIKLVTDK